MDRTSRIREMQELARRISEERDATKRAALVERYDALSDEEAEVLDAQGGRSKSGGARPHIRGGSYQTRMMTPDL